MVCTGKGIFFSTGPEGDESTGREFLSSLYEGLAMKYGRHYVSRFTEATNTEDFKAIFSFVKTNVSMNMISRGGLLWGDIANLWSKEETNISQLHHLISHNIINAKEISLLWWILWKIVHPSPVVGYFPDKYSTTNAFCSCRWCSDVWISVQFFYTSLSAL